MKKIFSFYGLVISLCSGVSHAVVKPDETVILLPTSGYINADNQWVIPVHGWIFEYEYDSLWRKASVNALLSSLQLGDVALDNELFKNRAWMFLVDNERWKKIAVTVNGKTFQCNRSKANGHFTGEAKLEAAGALQLQKPAWISYEVVLKSEDQRRFSGETQLLPPQGVSVVSDIDDTIKDSQVSDKKELLKNTFLKEFRAVQGMAGLYQQWQQQGAAFHYLSASPWQLYPSLAEFIRDYEFPRGDFHLRQFRIKDSSFYELFASPFEYKIQTIEGILHNYPQRKFVLVGDSTESDPEVYSYIARKYPNQIIKILIRNATHKNDLQDVESAFSGLDNDLWLIFDEPAELAQLQMK